MVYKLQGVDINDKHFEIIIKQMLRKRRIVDPGDSRFLVNEEVDREELEEEKENVIVGNLIPAGTGVDEYSKVEVVEKGQRLLFGEELKEREE